MTPIAPYGPIETQILQLGTQYTTLTILIWEFSPKSKNDQITPTFEIGNFWPNLKSYPISLKGWANPFDVLVTDRPKYLILISCPSLGIY